jgi:hypothetical protein
MNDIKIGDKLYLGDVNLRNYGIIPNTIVEVIRINNNTCTVQFYDNTLVDIPFEVANKLREKYISMKFNDTLDKLLK